MPCANNTHTRRRYLQGFQTCWHKEKWPKASCVSKNSTAEVLSPFYLVHANASAFTQFNYESVSLGNSGAKEGLLMEVVLRDQLLVLPLKSSSSERREVGESVLLALER